MLGVDVCLCWCVFLFQAEDGIRYLVRSRGLGDVYKRQIFASDITYLSGDELLKAGGFKSGKQVVLIACPPCCLLYTSDAAAERSSVDLGGRRIIKKKTLDNI